MYVCICHEVTDQDIKQAVTNGARSVNDLRDTLRVGASCGRCEGCAEEYIKQSKTSAFRLKTPVSSFEMDDSVPVL